jgi:hypothetical protein
MVGFTGLLADGGAPVVSLSCAVGDNKTNATAAASVTFKANGSITYTGNTSSGPANWYLPTGQRPGAFYVKFHLTSGTTWTPGPTDNAVIAMSSDQVLAWNAPLGNTRTATVAVTVYSDAGGVNQVASGTITVNVVSTTA